MANEANEFQREQKGEYITTGEASEVIGCSKETVKSWVDTGFLPAITKVTDSQGNVRRFIKVEDVYKRKAGYEEWKARTQVSKTQVSKTQVSNQKIPSVEPATNPVEGEFLYKVGMKIPIICSWTQCSKRFIWEVKEDANTIRKCCSQECGLRGKVYHTLEMLKKANQDTVHLSIDQCCECIRLRAKLYDFIEIATKLGLHVPQVRYFLSHELVQERHKSDLTLKSKPKRKTPSHIKGGAPYIATTPEMREAIIEKLNQGFPPFRVAKFFNVPRNRVYDIRQELMRNTPITKEDLLSIPGAKDITKEIDVLRFGEIEPTEHIKPKEISFVGYSEKLKKRVEEIRWRRIKEVLSRGKQEEITLNGKRYREVID